jgi:SnoaL-like polyketide cyclase
MTAAENKNAIRATFGACDSARNMEALRLLVAPGYRAHFPGMPESDGETMAAIGSAFYAAFSDLKHTLHEMAAEDDLVSVRLTISGTHDGPFQTPQGTLPASGRPMTIEALNMFKFADGRPIEQWITFDLMTFMQQIAPQQQ